MKCRVRAIVRKGNELLLVQHKNPAGESTSAWALPGGGVEDGEMIIDALQREMIEETGIAPQIGDLRFIHQFKRNGIYEGPEFFFEVINSEDYDTIDLSRTTHGLHEIARIGFFEPQNLDGLLPEFLKDKILLQSKQIQIIINED